jgi:hypothetical protein
MKGKRAMKEKKYIVILVMFLMSLTCSVRAFDIPLENSDFELPGDGKIKGWDLEDGAYYSEVEGNPPAEVPGWESDFAIVDSGVESAYLSPTGDKWRGFLYNKDGSAYNFSDFAITPKRTYTLYFEANGFEEGTDSTKASLIYGSPSDRKEIVSTTISPGDWTNFSLSFTSNDYPAAIGGTIGVEFQNITGTDVDSWTGIDNVRIETTDFVTLVGPEDGSVGQPIDSILEWTVSNGWACNVYFGTDPNTRDNTQVITGQVADYHDPGTLPYSTTYYWAVDAIDPNDGFPFAQPGPTWTFKTVSDIPEITVQPVSVAVFEGETVQFSVTSISAFMPHTHKWYREGVPLEDGTKYSGTATETLTVYDVELADQGDNFQCEITNSQGSVLTDEVNILMKRLLAHYKFEGDLTDELGENDGSVVDGKLAYVSGIDDGLAVESDKKAYIELSTEAYPKAGVGNGLPEGTVSCWVKIGYIGTEYRMFGNINSSGTAVLLKAPVFENDFVGLAGFWIRDDVGVGAEVHSAVGVCDGQWHHLAATWNCAEGFFRIYVDGVQDGEEQVPGMGAFSGWQNPMAILAGMEGGSTYYPYAEPLDELQFYNYAMTRTEIAGIYYDQTGIELCAVEYPSEYDLSGPEGVPDCNIDMYDTAELFGSWLECGLYPECP